MHCIHLAALLQGCAGMNRCVNTGLCTAVELTQIHTLILHLQRLGFIRHNPAHKLFSLQPPLRPLLLSVAQHEADLYSSSVLGLAQCCLEVCSLASAVFASHAEVSSCCSALYAGG